MTADELDAYIGGSRLLSVYEELERDILKELAGMIAGASSTVYQEERLALVREAQASIKKIMNNAAASTRAELATLLYDGADEAIQIDNALFKDAGLNPADINDSEAMQRVIAAQFELAEKAFINLTATTAQNAGNQLYTILSEISAQVTSGAFTYDQAIKHGLTKLGNAGVTAVVYDSGVKTSLYAATRRALLTSVNQTALRVAETQMDEMGVDLVQVNAHIGARTGSGINNHAEWQGKVYSRSGRSGKYASLTEATGYGNVAGLGGANCRHSFNAYIEGMGKPLTQDDLNRMNAETVRYQGKDLPIADALAQQRYLERGVRSWKNKEAVYKAGGLDTAGAKAHVAQWQSRLREFTKQTGLKRDYTRERA